MLYPSVGRVCTLLLLFTSRYYAAPQEGANSASVTVKVSDRLGTAVANTRVYFLEHSSKSQKEQTTDETGTATVQLQPGSFDLGVTSPRPDLMSLIVRDVEVKRGEHRQLDLVLKAKVPGIIDFVDPLEGLEPERAPLGDLDEPTKKATTQAATQQGCRYIHSRSSLAGYESGGPYRLDHFSLTRGRTDLREFLWMHWHAHKKGVAEARVGTVDRGTVKVLYLVQPDVQGYWGIDVELDRSMDPPCVSFRADSLVRLPIQNPEEEYPSQTIGLWPPDKIPSKRLADSEVVDPKLYRLVLIRNNKPVSSDAI